MLPNHKLDVANAIACHQSLLENRLVTLTLLIDIDDTLLGNKMENFIPAYIQLLGQHLRPYADPEKVGQVLTTATGQMFYNDQPDRTLKETFDTYFYAPLVITEDQVRGEIDHFYDEIFPEIQSVTEFRPSAAKLMDQAVKRGWKIAIATNPFFPLKAILHRLSWAGVPAEKYPYMVVPSYETFHFGKPNPAFLAELLGRIGWPLGPLVMIGNDPENDIRAAQLIGLATFWVSNGLSYPNDMQEPCASGSLDDFLYWIDKEPEGNLLPDYSSKSAIIAIMQGVPPALLSMTNNLTEEVWKQRPSTKDWSLTEIACHLRDVEKEINQPRLTKITREKRPFVPGVDSDIWANERDYQSQDGAAALQSFVETRKQTLEILTDLSEDDWKKPAQHAIFGPTNLTEIANIMAGHDRLHIRQAYCTL